MFESTGTLKKQNLTPKKKKKNFLHIKPGLKTVALLSLSVAVLSPIHLTPAGSLGNTPQTPIF